MLKIIVIISALMAANSASAWEFFCAGYERTTFGNLIISKEDGTNDIHGFSLNTDYSFQGQVTSASGNFEGQYDFDGDGIYPKFYQIIVSDGTRLVLELDKAETDSDGWTTAPTYLEATTVGGAYNIGRCGWK